MQVNINDEREAIARKALADLGWHLEDRAGMRLKVEDDGGVGTATSGEMIMYDALAAILALRTKEPSRG